MPRNITISKEERYEICDKVAKATVNAITKLNKANRLVDEASYTMRKMLDELPEAFGLLKNDYEYIRNQYIIEINFRWEGYFLVNIRWHITEKYPQIEATILK